LAEPYRGVCIRRIKITNQNELDYYQIGKIFRFKNIISANISLDKMNDYKDGTNVVFHIYSTQGKQVREFLDPGSYID